MELLICLLIVIAIVCLMVTMRNKESFKADSKRFTFIKFYTPWCGYCIRLAPEWEKLKKHYSHKLNFEEYNCDINKDMCSRHDIIGYPTLKIRDNITKKFLQYDGPREYHLMAAFLDTVLGR
jgi:thiol-disulfide isomerase/thioredoxin